MKQQNKSYGVVCFDHPVKNVGGGWACISNETPFYVLSLDDLSPQCVWHTNIHSTKFDEMNLEQYLHLRSDGYISTPLMNIIDELGLAELLIDKQVEKLAKIFSNVMRFFEFHTGEQYAPLGMLNNGIRSSCMPDEYPVTSDIHYACRSAADLPINIHNSEFDLENKHIISLPFHRFKYTQFILDAALPSGAWSKVDASILKSNQDSLSRWISKSKVPVLVKIALQSIHRACANIMEFTAEYSGGEYVWITSMEFIELSKYSEQHIDDILICESFDEGVVRTPAWSYLALHSYSFGLYCESLWTSLTKSLSGQSAKTPLSAWVHSVDRAACFSTAKLIAKNNEVSVLGFGKGKIAIDVDGYSQASSIALLHQLLVPMATLDDRQHKDIPLDSSYIDVIQVAMCRGARDFIEVEDSKAIEAINDLHLMLVN